MKIGDVIRGELRLDRQLYNGGFVGEVVGVERYEREYMGKDGSGI